MNFTVKITRYAAGSIKNAGKYICNVFKAVVIDDCKDFDGAELTKTEKAPWSDPTPQIGIVLKDKESGLVTYERYQLKGFYHKGEGFNAQMKTALEKANPGSKVVVVTGRGGEEYVCLKSKDGIITRIENPANTEKSMNRLNYLLNLALGDNLEQLGEEADAEDVCALLSNKEMATGEIGVELVESTYTGKRNGTSTLFDVKIFNPASEKAVEAVADTNESSEF